MSEDQYKTLRACLLGILACVILAACCNAAEPVRIQYTYQHAVHGKVTGHGTAFPVEKRRLLTAAHTILRESGGLHAVQFEHVSGGIEFWLPARVEWFDTDTDVAMLAVDIDLEPYSLADASPKIKDKLLLVGAPHGEPVRALLALTTDIWVRGWAKHAAMTDGFKHGMSGGPVLSGDKVAGMIVAGKQTPDGKLDERVCFFVPVEVLRGIMQARAAP